MNKTLRKAIVAGNWKMNNDRNAAKKLITELNPLVKDAACEVVLCVPYTNLETALSLCEGTNMVQKTATGQNPAHLPVRSPLRCSLKWALNMLSSVTPNADSTSVKPTRPFRQEFVQHWMQA